MKRPYWEMVFARVCRGGNGLLFSSLNIVIIAWRLARKVVEFGPDSILVVESKGMSGSISPASAELLVRFPNTEDAIVQ